MEPLPEERKIRLFTALAIPDDLRSTLIKLPNGKLEHGQWNHPDDFHITLRFLGEVPEEKVSAIRETLFRIKRPSFFVEAEGLGYFSLKKQTVLWAGVQNTRKLTALAADINESLIPLDFEMPRKPYVPHITLARLNSARGIDDYIKRYGKNIHTQWQADSFSLYQSGDSVENGSRYTILEKYPLLATAR